VQSFLLSPLTWWGLKNVVFWDLMQCGFCKNRRFGWTQRLHHQGDKNRWVRNNVSSNKQPKHAEMQSVTAHVVPSSPILVSLMMEALRSSETSDLTGATRHNIAEDGILHSRRREATFLEIKFIQWWVRQSHVKFKVFTAVTIKNASFWGASPCGSYNNRRFGGKYYLHHQGGQGTTLAVPSNRSTQR
jgi:hypothetical protein